ncbi:MAG: DUF3604 domain-containing protein [Halioglobus sp.]
MRSFGIILCCVVLMRSIFCDAAIDYTEQRQPCASYNPLMQPFFGDLHVHTRYSLDASTQGTRTTPEQAYRFARGEKIAIQPWADGKSVRSMQLHRPLDFAAVTDHAELFGEVHMCDTPSSEGYGSWQCIIYRNWSWGAYYLFNYMASMRAAHLGLCGEDDQLCNRAALVPWADTQQAAESMYDRSTDCRFTTFVGYEWTGMQPDSGGNLHRNVLFRNARAPLRPITFIDAPAAETLWRRLDKECIKGITGCDALTIPHNSNLSAGYMFNGKRDDGSPMTVDYARLRHRFEPLMEIMQKGGASECFYGGGDTADELCNFEQQPIDNLAGFNNPPDRETGFARRSLAQGMLLEREFGINPYQLGFVGSTDTHLGAAGAVGEEGYIGHGDAGVSAKEVVPPGLPDLLTNNPGGLAVLWAEENSRDALFESMRRRETYATSGPRIVTRFFGGWNYPALICADPDRIARAYASGVPMGGQLAAQTSEYPTFLVVAGWDPGTVEQPGTPLQRVQIVKVWLTAKGWIREKVFDVAGDPGGDSSLDSASCDVAEKGFEELCTVWTDDEFKPDQQAYYYTRVVEYPSCRWSQRICVAQGVDCSRPETVGEGLRACCSPQHQPVIQERAWSSPIWYTPPSLPAPVVTQ